MIKAAMLGEREVSGRRCRRGRGEMAAAVVVPRSEIKWWGNVIGLLTVMFKETDFLSFFPVFFSRYFCFVLSSGQFLLNCNPSS